MSGPADDFLEAAESGDPKAYVAQQNASELLALMDYTEKIWRANQTKGGFPRDLLMICAIETSNRYRKLTHP